MDKDLDKLIKTQMKFQEAVLENIELTRKHIDSIKTRVQITNERIDIQQRIIDRILEQFKKNIK